MGEKIDKLFVELKEDWIKSYTNKVLDEEDMKSYCLWKDAGDAYINIIPKIAYAHDCTYVEMLDEFHFAGIDV